MARNQIKARLISYFDQRVGQVITLNDLAREFVDLSADQIRTGINNARNSPANESGGLDMRSSIMVVARGNAWCWRPVNATLPGETPSPSKRCFEEIGPTKDGSILVQADDGTIWKAVEL